MKELTQISQVVIDALKQAGIRLWPRIPRSGPDSMTVRWPQ